MNKINIYAEITNKVIEQLKQGVIPWEKPWIGDGGAYSHATGKPYSLMNQLILQEPGEYFTFNQVKQAGGKVKKGAKSQRVIFWKFIKQNMKDDNGDTIKDNSFPVLKCFNVFHESQIEGVELKGKMEAPGADEAPIADDVADNYIKREGITYREGNTDNAYYSPSSDTVTMPSRETFVSTNGYYGTKFHELVHSTGAAKRLDRGIDAVAGFGSDNYSREELVAEIGSGAILNRLELVDEKGERNTTAYLQSWIGALENDEKALVVAAGKAEKAVKYIFGEEVEA